MISSAYPERVWLTKQLSSYRLAYRRMYAAGKSVSGYNHYRANRNNDTLRRLEVDSYTPLRPGEKEH